MEYKKTKIKQDLFRALVHEATHQMKRFENWTETDEIKIDKLLDLDDRNHLPKSSN